MNTVAFLLLINFIAVCCNDNHSHKPDLNVVDSAVWHAPDTAFLAELTPEAQQIRYGRELIKNTARYLGPSGIVARISNGMNCGNCHLEAGTRLNGNNFAMVAPTYPRFRKRSARVESVEFRVNDCLQRSLNGQKLDSPNKEMQAMVAYIKWVGKDVAKNTKPAGMGIPEIPFLERAAVVENGRKVFAIQCSRCHGANGAGVLQPDSAGYIYPPLWGPHSFNVSAGIFMLSKLAGFVKYNMPYVLPQQAPTLSDEDAWDVAAFVNSQERPNKMFQGDWPVLADKPVDFPFGPYADSFSELQHKYGPFSAIKKARAK